MIFDVSNDAGANGKVVHDGRGHVNHFPAKLTSENERKSLSGVRHVEGVRLRFDVVRPPTHCAFIQKADVTDEIPFCVVKKRALNRVRKRDGKHDKNCCKLGKVCCVPSRFLSRTPAARNVQVFDVERGGEDADDQFSTRLARIQKLDI